MTICLFFFNDTATTEIYTLSLHDALPISPLPLASGPLLVVKNGSKMRRSFSGAMPQPVSRTTTSTVWLATSWLTDRKSTRLNSSHANISYAVFCLKKKKNKLNSHELRHKQ